MTVLAIADVLQDAKDGIDLWYAFIIGLPGLVAAIGVIYGQHKAKERWSRQEKQGDEIREEVKNNHAENLRDEITRGFREIRADISGLREELRTERVERIEGDKREVA